jgi:hypothetical protein
VGVGVGVGVGAGVGVGVSVGTGVTDALGDDDPIANGVLDRGGRVTRTIASTTMAAVSTPPAIAAQCHQGRPVGMTTPGGSMPSPPSGAGGGIPAGGGGDPAGGGGGGALSPGGPISARLAGRHRLVWLKWAPDGLPRCRGQFSLRGLNGALG